MRTTWTQLKAFVNKYSLSIYYYELDSCYFVGADKCSIQLLTKISKESPKSMEQIEFEEGYKDKYPIEDSRTRITTCRQGRKLHSRFITFKTSSQDDFDNTDWQDIDYGDVTYLMKNSDKETTLNPEECKETHIIFEPTYHYEIAAGKLFVPTTLSGDEDAWEVHVVGVPDIPQNLGGTIHLIANPRIKWIKGSWLEIDSSMNPSSMQYSPIYHSNKILTVVKHPIAAQIEFQINYVLYK